MTTRQWSILEQNICCIQESSDSNNEAANTIKRRSLLETSATQDFRKSRTKVRRTRLKQRKVGVIFTLVISLPRYGYRKSDLQTFRHRNNFQVVFYFSVISSQKKNPAPDISVFVPDANFKQPRTSRSWRASGFPPPPPYPLNLNPTSRFFLKIRKGEPHIFCNPSYLIPPFIPNIPFKWTSDAILKS